MAGNTIEENVGDSVLTECCKTWYVLTEGPETRFRGDRFNAESLDGEEGVVTYMHSTDEWLCYGCDMVDYSFQNI